jgi:hypothetical protein
MGESSKSGSVGGPGRQRPGLSRYFGTARSGGRRGFRPLALPGFDRRASDRPGGVRAPPPAGMTQGTQGRTTMSDQPAQGLT